MNTVPPFTAAARPSEIEAATAATHQILSTGLLTLGPYTNEFEDAVATMASSAHAVAVSSGSTALEIIFRALEVQDREVLVPTNTNFATAAAALRAGARVQLYDGGLYPDITDLTARMHDEVAAVVVVHIGGHLAPHLPQIADLCQAHAVPLIEDAAHAHGSALNSRPAGTFGTAAAWSFFATKVISTGGEGGAITTNDPDLAKAARVYRNQGKDENNRHVVMGNSWRLPELNAAIGTAQLSTLAADVAARRRVIDTYAAALADIGLTFPALAADSEISGHKAIALLPHDIDRDQWRAILADQQVQLSRGVYDEPLHQQPVFLTAGLNTSDLFPAAQDFAARHICLPLWRDMPSSAVDAVINASTAAMTASGGG